MEIKTNDNYLIKEGTEIFYKGDMANCSGFFTVIKIEKCEWHGYKISIKELKSGIRRREVTGIRALIAIGLVIKQGIALAEVARRVGVSNAAVSKIIERAS